MSEIKKGDWVYTEEEDGEHIFLCSGTGAEYITGGDDWWFRQCCHLLEPLKPGDKLEVGDRVAVIGREIGDPQLGEIHSVLVTRYGNLDLVVIDFTVDGTLMHYPQLARLPDCAQDERCETSDEKETHRADRPIHPNCVCNMISVPICESCATLEKKEREEVRRNRDDQPIPYVLNDERCQPSGVDSIYSDTVKQDQTPCPHPEWEGIWKTQYGTIVHARWVHDNGPKSMWKKKECASTSWGDWDGPDDSWTQIEPAPNVSTPGKKLGRPRKHGGIKTPWDPWEI